MDLQCQKKVFPAEVPITIMIIINESAKQLFPKCGNAFCPNLRTAKKHKDLRERQLVTPKLISDSKLMKAKVEAKAKKTQP